MNPETRPPPRRTDFRCLDRQRVRWAEIDAQQIVFNGHYLMYFDTAVAAYWRALALPYAAAMQRLGGDLFVRKATVEYAAPAGYDDVIDVGVRCARIGTSSMVFEAAVFRAATLLVQGELVYVYADPVARTSRPVPDALRALLDNHERGAPSLSWQQGRWDVMAPLAQPLRHAVFVDELGVPAALERDDLDAQATHIVALNGLGMAVGTGRWVPVAPGVARIGRVAVTRPLRGGAIGAALLQALCDSARDAGLQRVTLSAQAAAVPFYRRAGFAEVGPGFIEAGLPHQEMERPLRAV